MYKLLLADLERFYFFQGKGCKKPGFFALFLYCFVPRFVPNVLCRAALFLYKKNLGVFAKFLSLINFVLFGIEIAARCEIGPGLIFPHTVGTVIGAERVGSNAMIYHGVTLGAKEMDMSYSKGKRPIVGDNVVIGSGAKIMGGITIGNNVIIGANAVVTKDIPDNVLVAGIPAKILKIIK